MAVTNLSFDGKACSRVVVTNLANNTVVFDTNTLSDYKVAFTTLQYGIALHRYDYDGVNYLLTREHRIFNYEQNSFMISITY